MKPLGRMRTSARDSRSGTAHRGSSFLVEASSSSLLDTLAQERASRFLSPGIDLAAEPDRTWLAALASGRQAGQR